jgi:Zn-dependent peptidase ImmA (M78 family)/transcriptional regulator with XRE-family HTH domain
MSKSVIAQVRPELLKWARETAGYLPEQAAKKAKVQMATLTDWESGAQRLDMVQLRRLSDIYDRPLAAFYLSSPPKEQKLPRDFRHVAGTKTGALSPSLISEIRQARDRRDIALDLYDEIGEKPLRFTLRATRHEDSSKVVRNLGVAVHLSDIQKRGVNSPNRTLTLLRAAVESLGVLVFQVPDIEVSETRGFSLSESLLPVIVLASGDAPEARIFTLLHEMTHLMLREPGICDQGSDAVEIYCNSVAGRALVPSDALATAIDALAPHPENTPWEDSDLLKLAHQFSASRETIARRLVDLELMSHDEYQEKREEYLRKREEYLKSPKVKKKGNGGPSQAALVLARVGLSFARLVLDGYQHERLTISDVTGYLSVRAKHLPTIERSVAKKLLAEGTT